MLILLSPAKKQTFGRELLETVETPPFIKQSEYLSAKLLSLSIDVIAEKMKINTHQAKATNDNFQSFANKSSPISSALSVYNGPAFSSLAPFSLSAEELIRAQNQLVILSALYGILHPNNLISPYRLEMGISLSVDSCTNLYHYWKNSLTEYIHTYCLKHNFKSIINCASTEYSKVIDFNTIGIPVITCDFREVKSGTIKSVSAFAKQARGMMARWIIQKSPQEHSELQNFNENGYSFSTQYSTDSYYCFLRETL